MARKHISKTHAPRGLTAMPRKRSNPIDALVGRNIRVHRLAKRLSQSELGSRLGVTFQQVQKYENGASRIAAGRLAKIAEILDVPITVFFDGAEQSQGRAGTVLASPLELISEPQRFRLLLAFSEIEQNETRRSILELVENIAAISKTTLSRRP